MKAETTESSQLSGLHNDAMRVRVDGKLLVTEVESMSVTEHRV